MSWTVEYYKESGRKSYPIKEFLDAIDDKAAAKFFRCFALLEEHGIEVREPYVKSLTGHGKLKEIRVKAAPNIYRIIYFIHIGKRIVLLHGFVKKTEKTPPGEIEIAEKRMKRFLEGE